VASATSASTALVLPVGDEWHAVALPSVREVLAAPAIAPLPDSPRWLAGLVNVRGEILPTIDTGRALGQGTTEPTHVAVVETAVGPVAVLTTGPPEPAVLGHRQGDGRGPGAAARYAIDEHRVATVLDLEALVR
jgi:purine-binding chemotaxis protein CheW